MKKLIKEICVKAGINPKRTLSGDVYPDLSAPENFCKLYELKLFPFAQSLSEIIGHSISIRDFLQKLNIALDVKHNIAFYIKTRMKTIKFV